MLKVSKDDRKGGRRVVKTMEVYMDYSIDNGLFSAYDVLNTPTKPLSPSPGMTRNHGGFFVGVGENRV